MKKIVLMVVAVLLLTGAAFGQTKDLFDDDSTLFDAFNVVSSESVESRLSRGLFTSMVDDYIGVGSFDPDVGTFFFMGGFYEDNTQDYLSDTKISFGLAKTFGFGYLGLYYGGHFVDATGNRSESNFGSGSTVVSHDATWANNIAVLFGTGSIGAFRLDLQLKDSENIKDDSNGTGSHTITPGGLIGLTWGGVDLSGLVPYVTLGIQLPEQETTFLSSGGTNYQTVENTGGYFGVQVGISHESGIWGDLGVVFGFANTAVGEMPGSKIDIIRADDRFQAGIRIGYSNTWEFGKVAFGLGPQVKFGFESTSPYYTDKINGNNSIEKKDFATTANIHLQALIDTGIKFQLSDKFDLYTGIGLKIIDWQSGTTTSAASASYKTTSTEWSFKGFEWLDESLLKFGLIFKPISGLVIGADISSVFDKIVMINPREMTIETGEIFGSSDLGFLEGIKFNLTVSFQVPPKNGRAGE